MYICKPLGVVNYPIVSHVFPYRQWNRFIMTTHTQKQTRDSVTLSHGDSSLKRGQKLPRPWFVGSYFMLIYNANLKVAIRNKMFNGFQSLPNMTKTGLCNGRQALKCKCE